MSFSISGITPGSASLNSLDPSSPANVPVIKATATQQIQDLASAGQSASVIASSLGVPVSQVDAALGITSTNTTNSTSEATALVALSGRLSIQA
jgi:hypothetical protein